MTAPAAAAAAVDPDALAADLGTLVRVPSVTGDERAAMLALAEMAEKRGLWAEVHEHDLAELRADPGHPGEEAPRDQLTCATVTLGAAADSETSPRLCLNGHLDVVGPGEAPWSFEPWAGDVVDGCLRGRGSVDMKGGIVAALHAMAAVATAGVAAAAEIVLQAVASEEDGGLGTFAALRRDADFDACLIPEPTGFDVVCAQAGSITFDGEVPGVGAHAALRLEGVSAIDRFVDVHLALQEHERRINSGVSHPLMRELELAYPVSVGRVESGTWASSVPDRLRFSGRAGVRIDETPEDARRELERAVSEACPEARLSFAGGRYAPGTTPPDHPFVAMVQAALAAETGSLPRLAGVPWGADMRQFCARGIPCVMAGTPGIELAHAADERVRLDEVVALARALARLIVLFGRGATSSPAKR
jgi:acetylornithine deacetylase